MKPTDGRPWAFGFSFTLAISGSVGILQSMNNPSSNLQNRSPGQKPQSVQPGGGWGMRVELAWGRWRRAFLRLAFPGYVQRMQEKRQGNCPDCPHDIIDSRDLKYWRNVCGYWFQPEDDRFRWRDRLPFARYGWAEMVVFTLLFVLLGIGITFAAWEYYWATGFLGLPLFLVWLEIIFFFRDPHRKIPEDANLFLSPADGTVTHVEEIDELDFPSGRALRISIFLSIFNVHLNRMPCQGRITNLRYFPGEFLDARDVESAVRNEQLWIDLDDGVQPLRVKQISGAYARRIVCWLKVGDQVKAGEKIGMIKLGSRTDLLVPANPDSQILVKVGDKVRAGTSVLIRAK